MQHDLTIVNTVVRKTEIIQNPNFSNTLSFANPKGASSIPMFLVIGSF